jgi:hypothetical protein
VWKSLGSDDEVTEKVKKWLRVKAKWIQEGDRCFVSRWCKAVEFEGAGVEKWGI